MMGLGALSNRFSPTLAKQGESRLSSCLKKINSTAGSKRKSVRVNKFGERMTTFCLSYLHRDKAPPAQNPRGKIQEPGGGCNVAQLDEASKTLTLRPATYHH